jgi:hypothetical protein
MDTGGDDRRMAIPAIPNRLRRARRDAGGIRAGIVLRAAVRYFEIQRYSGAKFHTGLKKSSTPCTLG